MSTGALWERCIFPWINLNICSMVYWQELGGLFLKKNHRIVSSCHRSYNQFYVYLTKHMTDPSSTSELKNTLHDVPERHKIRQSPDFMAPKLWKGRSGASQFWRLKIRQSGVFNTKFVDPGISETHKLGKKPFWSGGCRHTPPVAYSLLILNEIGSRLQTLVDTVILRPFLKCPAFLRLEKYKK